MAPEIQSYQKNEDICLPFNNRNVCKFIGKLYELKQLVICNQHVKNEKKQIFLKFDHVFMLGPAELSSLGFYHMKTKHFCFEIMQSVGVFLNVS